MPTVVLTSTSAPVPLAPAAFQPQLRILKRPTTATAPAPAPPTPPGESLKEREARYQAARERIFGTEDTVEKKKAGGVVRNPKGPSDTLNSDPKGFSSPRTRTPPERRKKTSGG
ncbi:hypothetical protein C8F01DRAFT_1243789 [Mycena amicta]|nr:hypothetical protein C8F01DRAFT_1243789 [Mycena amicta]